MMKSICSRTLMMKFDSVSMSGINLNVIASVNIQTTCIIQTFTTNDIERKWSL